MFRKNDIQVCSMSNSANLLTSHSFEFRLLKAKNRMFNFDWQKMNTFESIRCSTYHRIFICRWILPLKEGCMPKRNWVWLGYLLSLPFPELPYKETWKISKLSFILKKYFIIAIHSWLKKKYATLLGKKRTLVAKKLFCMKRFD